MKKNLTGVSTLWLMSAVLVIQRITSHDEWNIKMLPRSRSIKLVWSIMIDAQIYLQGRERHVDIKCILNRLKLSLVDVNGCVVFFTRLWNFSFCSCQSNKKWEMRSEINEQKFVFKKIFSLCIIMHIEPKWTIGVSIKSRILDNN